MKTNLSALFILSLLSLNPFCVGSIAPSAHADEAVSAPPVVAPAQPISPAQVNSATNGGTASAIVTSTSAPASAQPQQSMTGMLLPFGLMLAIMYFLMIRPQQKKMKAHQALITQLKSGDEVVTNGGIIGTITGINEKIVTLEISKNVQMKILKSQVNAVVNGSIPELQA